MSIAIINQNFSTLEEALAAYAKVIAFSATHKGRPMDIFGKDKPEGANCKLSVNIRKFTGMGWEVLTDATLWFNFDDVLQATSQEGAVMEQIRGLLPKTNVDPGYVLRIGFVA